MFYGINTNTQENETILTSVAYKFYPESWRWSEASDDDGFTFYFPTYEEALEYAEEQDEHVEVRFLTLDEREEEARRRLLERVNSAAIWGTTEETSVLESIQNALEANGLNQLICDIEMSEEIKPNWGICWLA